MKRPYKNDEKGTIDLDTLTIDDGTAYPDGPHDAPRFVAHVYTNGNDWGKAIWTTVDWDRAAEDWSDACDWANPDYLVDANGYRYTR